MWRDCLETKAASPYLTHMLPLGGIQSLRFCPYEDVLGVGCAGGISSVLIPGAGEPNFDSFVANPFQGKKERQEQEVVQLLDKLQPETIMLDPAAIGKVRRERGCRAVCVCSRRNCDLPGFQLGLLRTLEVTCPCMCMPPGLKLGVASPRSVQLVGCVHTCCALHEPFLHVAASVYCNFGGFVSVFPPIV